MTDTVSKTQIDKLGERLRAGKQSSEDFLLLESYRQSFAKAFEATIDLINKSLNLVATGRPSKSTPSILEKLRRESIRLSQIQDIAGCRIPLVK